ncbi:MAG: CAP domain-containing protein [Longimicrobiales bacterium]
MRVVILAAVCTAAACQLLTTSDNLAPSDAPAEVRSFVELMNEHRQERGCAPLTWDNRIAGVASAHSEDMARNNYFSHTNLQGQSPFDRLRADGVQFRAAGENIAYGQTTGRQVLQSWLNSAGHRSNIENCQYTRHGVGLNQTRWTHVFVGTG